MTHVFNALSSNYNYFLCKSAQHWTKFGSLGLLQNLIQVCTKIEPSADLHIIILHGFVSGDVSIDSVFTY